VQTNQRRNFTRGHAYGKVSHIPKYITTRSRRINKLYIKVKNDDNKCNNLAEYIKIVIDSTGIKFINRGQWMHDKLNVKKKGYLKIQVAVNVKIKKILAMMVTDKHVHDSKALSVLIDNVIESDKQITIGKIIADGAYKCNDIFRFLAQNGICHASK
jgi:hypothetical protein